MTVWMKIFTCSSFTEFTLLVNYSLKFLHWIVNYNKCFFHSCRGFRPHVWQKDPLNPDMSPIITVFPPCWITSTVPLPTCEVITSIAGCYEITMSSLEWEANDIMPSCAVKSNFNVQGPRCRETVTDTAIATKSSIYNRCLPTPVVD